MNNPTKRNSKILKSLRDNKNALESKRTRTSMLLATRITKGTKDKNWSKTYFAEQIGKKPSVISKWLSGTHNFTSDTLSDIELVLSIELLNLENQVPRKKVVISAPTNASPKILVQNKA